MDCELGEDYQLEPDSAPEAREKAAIKPSWSERHPRLAGLVGLAGIIALILAAAYGAGDGAVVGTVFRLVAVALLSVVRDVPWWGWALFAAYLVLRDRERASNERWNITRELMEANCKLLAQIRDELHNRRMGS